MADTNIEITQGTGTNIDTRTEATNGNHRQVVVIGDPSTNAGVAPVDATAGVKVDLGSDNDVTVTSSALPTGAATAANQTTANTSLSSIDTKLSGPMPSSDETSTVYSGTTALTPKFAAIAASSSGNNTLVAAVASKKIRVLSFTLVGSGTVNAKFQSGAGGTDLTGLFYMTAYSGASVTYSPVGHFETASNTLLNLNLSAATAVGGHLTYIEV